VAKEEAIQTEGRVEEVLPNAMFRVRIADNHVITAIISGRMRQNRIQILLGDRVRIEMSPYDMTKGRVVYRDR
jgi:translation initiation factor IF-1